MSIFNFSKNLCQFCAKGLGWGKLPEPILREMYLNVNIDHWRTFIRSWERLEILDRIGNIREVALTHLAIEVK
jgi:hypothetical protein